MLFAESIEMPEYDLYGHCWIQSKQNLANIVTDMRHVAGYGTGR